MSYPERLDETDSERIARRACSGEYTEGQIDWEIEEAIKRAISGVTAERDEWKAKWDEIRLERDALGLECSEWRARYEAAIEVRLKRTVTVRPEFSAEE